MAFEPWMQVPRTFVVGRSRGGGFLLPTTKADGVDEQDSFGHQEERGEVELLKLAIRDSGHGLLGNDVGYSFGDPPEILQRDQETADRRQCRADPHCPV